MQTSGSANLAMVASRILAAMGDLQNAHQLLNGHQNSAAFLGTTDVTGEICTKWRTGRGKHSDERNEKEEQRKQSH
jgi:hypothetical protein